MESLINKTKIEKIKEIMSFMNKKETDLILYWHWETVKTEYYGIKDHKTIKY